MLSFDTFYDLCKYYYTALIVGSSIEDTVDVHGEQFDIAVYRLYDDFVFDSTSTVNSIFKYCKEVDCATQIIIGRNITVNEGVTLIHPFRCKGLVIYDPALFLNKGSVSMTSRGAKAVGKNIYLLQNEDFSYEFIPAVGGAGGARVTSKSNSCWSGIVGESPSDRKSGGVGIHSGSSFSSGNGSTGTGGTIILFCKILDSNEISSKGSGGGYSGCDAGGGSSGGGSINLFYSRVQSLGNIYSNGGGGSTATTNRYGGDSRGAGGNGCITKTERSDLFHDFKFLVIDSDKVKYWKDTK